ncbi:MAG: hypothetical protein C5B51_11995 [Terriglobia bacterium]|nr:MAG: hypothetical protein C5B51_11995 [Terriglobia bacterium]
MDLIHGSSDDQLDTLFRAYHKACPTPEPSSNFMPHLWHRIETRQRSAFSFRRMASALVTAAMAASVALGVYMAIPRNPIYYSTYLETLAEANTIETPDMVAPVHLILSERQ